MHQPDLFFSFALCLCGFSSLIGMFGLSLAGKIVFAAPSRPLVMQQIEACHNIVGIPQVRCFVLLVNGMMISSSINSDWELSFITVIYKLIAGMDN